MNEEQEIIFRVPVTKILDIVAHPNADKLLVAKIFDFNVIINKDNNYKIGDTVIFCPIDTIIPAWLELRLFDANSKIKLEHSRIRQIRIRGFASQGMIINISDVQDKLKSKHLEEGQNLAEVLGFTKYEPPVKDHSHNGPSVKKLRNKSYENPHFHQYGGLQNIKYYPSLFEDGQEVVFTEKIHGSNGRASISPFVTKTLFQKIKGLFGLNPKYQFCYGSNTVQYQSKAFSGYYDKDIYSEACHKYDLEHKLQPHETVYFEIYGSSVQKNYMYDCESGERKIAVFDVKVLSEDKKSTNWLKHDELVEWCKTRNLPMVPIVYRGPYSKEIANQNSMGISLLCDKEKVREGIVLKDPNETMTFFGKKYLKLLSEDYLNDINNSDFH